MFHCHVFYLLINMPFILKAPPGGDLVIVALVYGLHLQLLRADGKRCHVG